MNDRTPHEAILLMESFGLAPDVRSTSFSSIKVWSKLYQAGPYFVDLMLRPGASALALRGEIMTESSTVPSEVTVTLRDHHGNAVSSTRASDGAFELEVERQGIYRLDVAFGRELLCLSELEVG